MLWPLGLELQGVLPHSFLSPGRESPACCLQPCQVLVVLRPLSLARIILRPAARYMCVHVHVKHAHW